MKKRIITIAGKLGSGKSTVGKKIAEILSYQHASTGDFMRSIAKERGITLQELSVIAESDSTVDKAIDANSIDLGTKENIVLDSRLGFYFIPDSFKVFLELDPVVAAGRILKDVENNPNRGAESKISFDSVENIVMSITERLDSERKRYLEIYGIKDQTAPENFDLVIDTGAPEFNNSINAVVENVIEKYNEWLAE